MPAAFLTKDVIPILSGWCDFCLWPYYVCLILHTWRGIWVVPFRARLTPVVGVFIYHHSRVVGESCADVIVLESIHVSHVSLAGHLLLRVCIFRFSVIVFLVTRSEERRVGKE